MLAAATLAACTEPPIQAEGQLGQLIPLAAKTDSSLPRLAFRMEGCPGTIGGCADFCDGTPETCPAGACMPLALDTGSSVTLLPNSSESYAIERRCFEVRAAAGLGRPDPSAQQLSEAVARFRFVDPPVVLAPTQSPGGYDWMMGDDTGAVAVGGVLGGNILLDFAVRIRNEVDEEGEASPRLALYREFPGNETALATQGFAYMRLQFPGRPLGAGVDDRCEFGGVDCELPGLDLTPDEEDLVYESTRLLMDACVAPPPCTVVYQAAADDPSVQTCKLRPGPASDVACTSAVAPIGGGLSASLVVATGLPGLVLFEDSATRMFGSLDELPSCAELDVMAQGEARACQVSMEGALHAPGWAPLQNQRVIRVRAVSLVTGNPESTGVSPCDRLRNRLNGLQDQCEAFDERSQPFKPDHAGQANSGYGVFITGEAHLDTGEVAPQTERWVRTIVIPPEAAMATAVRRDVGSAAVEVDGMIGSPLLSGTDLVIDYTEEVERPGLRVACLEPGAPDCQAIPSCRPQVAGTRDSVGTASCCYGLPQNLLASTVLGGVDKPTPRLEDACCAALRPDSLVSLQADGLCPGVDPP